MLRDILEVKPGKEDEEDSKISLGIYLYLVFGENMLVENIPQVYSHLELLSVSIPYIRVLLENNQEIFVFKGVLLLKSLLQETHLSKTKYENILRRNFLSVYYFSMGP